MLYKSVTLTWDIWDSPSNPGVMGCPRKHCESWGVLGNVVSHGMS